MDRKKDKATLNRAYNDPGGLNAAFNRNILNNLNALADGDFAPEKWIHRAFYEDQHGRIELWLVSAEDRRFVLSRAAGRPRRSARSHQEMSFPRLTGMPS